MSQGELPYVRGNDALFTAGFVGPNTVGVLLAPLGGIGALLLLLLPTGWLDMQLRSDTLAFWTFVAFLIAACGVTWAHMTWMAIYNGPIDGVRHIFIRKPYPMGLRVKIILAFIVVFTAWALVRMQLRPNVWLPWTTGGIACLGLYLQFGTSIFGIPVRRVNDEEWDMLLTPPERRHARSLQHALARGVEGINPERAPVMAPSEARVNFAKLHGMADLKRRLLEAARPVFEPRKPQSNQAPPRNGILLFGEPGNGKTFVAEALAGELGVRFLTLDWGRVVSKFVGDTPERITQAFAEARVSAPCVLFIDEIDSFIVDRDSASHNTQESAQIVNVLLTELVNIRAHQVLVVAATNRLSKLDSAAIREGRFDHKIEVSPPDLPARIGLLSDSLQKALGGAAGAGVDRVDLQALNSAAERWVGFSVKRIQAVGEEVPAYLREHPSPVVGYEQLMGALRRLQGRKGKLPENTQSLSDLVLPDATREALGLIARRIADPLRVERLGGTLPTGALFHGPAGTGKTAAARALAKETGWAFLAVSGPELLKDLDALERLYQEAKDIRPAIIFIDEADDILRERQGSATAALTNRMLTILDGAGGQIKDILFIAATNNPETVDAAMLRAGRFTEKVPFFAASGETAQALIERWIAAKGAHLAPGVTALRLAKLLEGVSPANIHGVMQHALNLAIDADASHDAERVLITMDQVVQALDVVQPE